MHVIENTPSVRTIARQQNIDLPGLLAILSLRRPDGSLTEEEFVGAVLDPIEGMKADEYGNRYLQIGEDPKVLWSCHTDTVSKDGGNQNIKWVGDTLALNEGKPGMSLGADDGAGLWLLLELIKVKKPGLYVFHRAEEVGGKGSAWLTKNTPELVNGIEMAVAFDRRKTGSIITHQRGGRCCSDKFAIAFATALSTTEGLDYDTDPTGSFTDTANYTDLIGECTNVSVGYDREHGPTETLDVAHLLRLREAMLAIDMSTLPVERKPGEVDEDDYGWYGYGGYGGSYRSRLLNGSNSARTMTQLEVMVELIKERAYTTALMLEGMGFTPIMLKEAMENYWKAENQKSKAAVSIEKKEEPEELELEDEVDQGIYCRDCSAVSSQMDMRFAFPIDGDACLECGSNNTEVVDYNVETLEVV